MAVPGYHYFYMHADDQTGSDTATAKWFPTPGTNRLIRAHVMLVNVNHSGKQDGFAADCYIESYNDKNGITHDGQYKRVWGSKPGDATDYIKEMHFRLNVNGCAADAVAIV